MKDRDWCKRIEYEINGLKECVKKLESGPGRQCRSSETIEIDIEWPEAWVRGLHFNAQKSHGVFELKEDGNYYSRDILFMSARDMEDSTGHDLLTEYLESEPVRVAFRAALYAIKDYAPEEDVVRVFLPEENRGIKKYNGVTSWYWLRPRLSGTASNFTNVPNGGNTSHNNASAVGGCAPAFCVGENRIILGGKPPVPPSWGWWVKK